ncbi:MAG: TraB/GumN family protein [Candidatus Thermoplasmatota archaeon]
MIVVIGTGHVFNLSKAIKNILYNENPDIIAVELDQKRYNALLTRRNNPSEYKKYTQNQPFVYRMLAKFQEGVAGKYGVQPGEEMLTAIQYSQNQQIPVDFVDKDAQKIFKKMIKSMTIKEKIRLFLNAVASVFIRKKDVEKEIDKIEENLEEYLTQIQKKFPTIKKVLIDERNQHIADKLQKMNETFDKIVAILGDGHLPGIEKIIQENDIEIQTIRLKQLKEKQNLLSKNSSYNARVQFEYRPP